jgi:hypothetical protein
MIQEKVIM